VGAEHGIAGGAGAESLAYSAGVRGADGTVGVGLFFDLRNPPGWRRPWAHHYRDTLDRIAAAEAMGCDAVWFSEHHFFEDGYLPQPLTFAAAVAARTTSVRIGTAILLAALRRPIQAAEEATIVDLISDGRMELGIGAGYRLPEYEAFGADIARRMSLTDGAVAEIRRLLDGGVLTPPPVQRPFPIWLGYQGPQGARRAGRLGVGLLSLDRALFDIYRDGLVEGGHDPASARLGGVVDILVADDPEAATQRILPFLAYQQDTYRRYRLEGTGAPAPSPVTAASLQEVLDATGRLPGLAVLTPDQAVSAIRERIQDLPVEHVYVWASIAGMPNDLADRHVELLLTQVRPALQGAH
jgi:alkanesulfonate monooxygenase SsuD/methylene tetrahydromethanopterin reductase-like flavin-dependent oxidoreductase (luciferase family)